MTTGNLLFIYELPHFSKFTQKYIGTSLALMQLYFTGKLFYAGGGGVAFKCFLVLLPFTWIAFGYILRKCSDTNITGRNIGKMKYKEIKKIFTTGYYDNKNKHYTKDEVYIRVGIVKEHMVACKKLQCKCRFLWEKIVKIKALASINYIEDEEVANLAPQSRSFDALFMSKEKCFFLVDKFILKTYSEERPKCSYSSMLYLTWMM